MAKVGKVQRKSHSQCHRATPYPLTSHSQKNLKDDEKSFYKASEKQDWEDATCSVCMEVPHNAVLLLCSSYNNGCRPYMCATSHRFSNCFEQYKKAYTKAPVQSLPLATNNSNLNAGESSDYAEVPELLCPLCRRQVKGWTVVEAARKFLNKKKRGCMQDECSFTGTYKELRKHVRSKHPCARPRDVDPIRKEKWKRLEYERERNDVISTILSSTPGAMVLGDYVLEPNDHTFYSDSDSDSESEEEYVDDDFFSMRSIGLGRNRPFLSSIGYGRGFEYDSLDMDHFELNRVAPTGPAAASRRGFHRILLGGRSRRRRRHRLPNASRYNS
ncbi:uncharacterized protein LOC114716622 [Neltuma alba]|uniref:uncharacterized protein LOC114716622 n=1 Tax=Neltuma alba TaxID=207710 RepID=UPI0010A52629|nr:uncharacterized protein LOC114716622 [Prosopis alba]XP_028757481.1 uncharacterized protein LOC114716622 [Prosopis alba]XP_028757482.1 uncharacterized protein LOC114716622 [Prosopis alba]